MPRSTLQRVEEKTLEMNVCENIINTIRSADPLFRSAYWRGVTLRLKRRVGLDVKLETGARAPFILMGLQFRRPVEKGYDNMRREEYHLFKINNNRANDQHLILWIPSQLAHSIPQQVRIHRLLVPTIPIPPRISSPLSKLPTKNHIYRRNTISSK